jgi:hypothetical protein
MKRQRLTSFYSFTKKYDFFSVVKVGDNWRWYLVQSFLCTGDLKSRRPQTNKQTNTGLFSVVFATMLGLVGVVGA